MVLHMPCAHLLAFEIVLRDELARVSPAVLVLRDGLVTIVLMDSPGISRKLSQSIPKSPKPFQIKSKSPKAHQKQIENHPKSNPNHFKSIPNQSRFTPKSPQTNKIASKPSQAYSKLT